VNESVGIETRALRKVFDDPQKGQVVAVRDVSFQCRYGEVFGLLGPNGAGKTTTLRMLSTVLRPSAGSATVGGHDVESDPLTVRRTIGFLSASTGLYGRLSAYETLEYFGKLHGLRGRRLKERVDKLIDLFEIGRFANVRCERLSTGMTQKVSIARAIVHDPAVLVLDEPTLGLDILVASTMIEFIEASRAEGKCILFSTHIMSEVERLCDRIGILHDGRLRAVGTLEELRELTSKQYLEEIFMTLARSDECEASGPVETPSVLGTEADGIAEGSVANE